MRDLFRVALIHLATVSLDKEFRHGRAKIIHGHSAFVQDGHEFHELTRIDSNSYRVRDNSWNSCLKSRHGGIEKPSSNHWHHRWHRPVSDRGITPYQYTQDLHTLWTAVQ